MKPFLKLKSVDEVLAYIDSIPSLPAEIIPLAQGLGRRLAEPFKASEDLPGFDRSTVDGYAVACRDIFGASETSPAMLTCVGECQMGKNPAFSLEAGQTARIPTGAMLPKGADGVVMVEYTRPAENNLIEICRSQAPGDNVVYSKDDAAKGATIIPQGALIQPQEIGALAAFGITQIAVYQRPQITIFSTGDEILPLNSSPQAGQVRDVNSYSISALCQANGASVHKGGIIPDDLERLHSQIRAALPHSDIIILSGGSSAGTKDYTIETFLSLPQANLIAHGVAISPGKPFIFVETNGKYLIGLPGHVAGALICARVFVKPMLERLQGGTEKAIVPTITATLSRSISSAQGRRDYIRCKLLKTANGYEAQPLTAPSAVISSMVEANGLVICPENKEGLAKDEKVEVELF